jgi:hypothetical protein
MGDFILGLVVIPLLAYPAFIIFIPFISFVSSPLLYLNELLLKNPSPSNFLLFSWLCFDFYLVFWIANAVINMKTPMHQWNEFFIMGVLCFCFAVSIYIAEKNDKTPK